MIPHPRKSEPHRLPMLEAGDGDRRNDCSLYGGCLDRWLRSTCRRRAHASDQAAQCPEGCGAYATPSRNERLELATMAARGAAGDVVYSVARVR